MKRYRISARHFRQNPHFPKGPFAISFEFLFTVWRFWRLSAISAIFVKYVIFANIATFKRAPLPLWGVISANINFQILLCHSPMLLFSFLRNSYMHVRILLFPFEFCHSLFWFYYAVMNSFIQFRILLFVFQFCDAVVQFCNSIVESSHAVLNPIISFPILLFTFPILLCQYQFCYSVSNSIIRFRIMFLQIRDFHSLFGRQCPGDQ